MADYQDSQAEVYQGDALEVLNTLAPESVHLCVTSPPYWGQRLYSGEQARVWGGDPNCPHQWGTEIVRRDRGAAKGATAQTGNQLREVSGVETRQGNICALCGAWRGALGSEPTPQLYVQHIVEVFRAVRRVLRTDGVCYLNLGDSRAGSWGNMSKTPFRDMPEGRPVTANPSQLARSRNLCGIPWRVAFALQEDGWQLIDAIIWAKQNTMPESVKDRCTKSYDFIFMLTKTTETLGWIHPVLGAVRKPDKQPEPDYYWQQVKGANFNVRVRDAKAGRATTEEGYQASAEELDAYEEGHEGLTVLAEQNTPPEGWTVKNKMDWRRLNRWRGFSYWYDSFACRQRSDAVRDSMLQLSYEHQNLPTMWPDSTADRILSTEKGTGICMPNLRKDSHHNLETNAEGQGISQTIVAEIQYQRTGQNDKGSIQPNRKGESSPQEVSTNGKRESDNPEKQQVGETSALSSELLCGRQRERSQSALSGNPEGEGYQQPLVPQAQNEDTGQIRPDSHRMGQDSTPVQAPLRILWSEGCPVNSRPYSASQSRGRAYISQHSACLSELQYSERHTPYSIAHSSNLRNVWSFSTESLGQFRFNGRVFNHFAAFPRELPRRAILLACPAYCCPQCGAGWRRVIQHSRPANYDPSEIDQKRHEGTGGFSTHRPLSAIFATSLQSTVKTIGWQPSCQCGGNTLETAVRGTVMDPFCGSGTSLLAARELGRKAIGIDLSQDYVALTTHRLALEQPAMMPVTEEVIDD